MYITFIHVLFKRDLEMNRYFFIILLLFFMCTAEQPSGFRDIQFGSTFDQSIEKLLAAKLIDSSMIEKQRNNFQELETIILKDYDLGGMSCKVDLEFNSNGLFTGFTIYGPSHRMLEFDKKVKENAILLSSIFEKKFGKPMIKTQIREPYKRRVV